MSQQYQPLTSRKTPDRSGWVVQSVKDQFLKYNTSTLVLSLVGVILVSLLLIFLTVHTQFWKELTWEHVDDADYKQLTGTTLTVDTVSLQDGSIETVFESPVVINGNVDFGRGPLTSEASLETEILTILNEIYLYNPAQDEYIEVIEQLINVSGSCDGVDLETLLEQAIEFRDRIINNSTTILDCLETNEATLVTLQDQNTDTTNNHTARLDILETNSCDQVISQAENFTDVLIGYNVTLNNINSTIIATDEQLEIILANLTSIINYYPTLATLSCNVNQTKLNNSIDDFTDLRTIFDGIDPFLDSAGNYSASCTVLLNNISQALDTYNSTIFPFFVVIETLNATYNQYLNNITSLTSEYDNLVIQINIHQNNFTTFNVSFTNCSDATAQLAARLTELWIRYNILLQTTIDQQTTFDNFQSTFNQTYTQFNATASQCVDQTALFDALQAEYNAFILMYTNNRTLFENTIARAINVTDDVALADSLIAILENNVTVIQSILSGIDSNLDLVNATLITINTILDTVENTLDLTNTTLQESNTLLTNMEALAPMINTTLQNLRNLVDTQTTTLNDHETRISTVENYTCPTITSYNQVAYYYPASENITIGDVVVIDETGGVKKATGLYKKDVFVLDPKSFTRDSISVTPSIPIDSSDHFYTSYALEDGTTPNITIGGTVFLEREIAIVKFSPVHGIIWTAKISGRGTGLAQQQIAILTYDNINNELFVLITASFSTDEDLLLYDADGTLSSYSLYDLTTGVPGFSQLETCIFAKINAMGEWTGSVSPIHSSRTAELYCFAAEAWNTGINPGGGKVLIAMNQFSSSTATTITYPGVGTYTVGTGNAGPSALWGLMDTSTMTFDYLNYPTFPFVDANERFVLFSLKIDSGNSAYMIGNWWLPTGAGSGVITFDNYFGSPNFTFSRARDASSTSMALVVQKIDLLTGLSLWVKASSMERLEIFPFDFGGTGTKYLDQEPEMGVDHYDRPIFTFTIVPGLDSNITFEGVTTESNPSASQYISVFRLDAYTGAVEGTKTIPRILDGTPPYNDRLEGNSIQVDSKGDVFLGISFADSSVIIDGVTYASPNQTSSLILSLGNNFEVKNSFLDDYGELAFVVDSHGNLWSFLHEDVALNGDVPTFNVTSGFGIVKLGQYDLEPSGVAGNTATVGNPVRVVQMGEIDYSHGFQRGFNVYNDHGTLTKFDTYAKTKIGVAASTTRLIVSIHRPEVTQGIV